MFRLFSRIKPRPIVVSNAPINLPAMSDLVKSVRKELADKRTSAQIAHQQSLERKRQNFKPLLELLKEFRGFYKGLYNGLTMVYEITANEDHVTVHWGKDLRYEFYYLSGDFHLSEYHWYRRKSYLRGRFELADRTESTDPSEIMRKFIRSVVEEEDKDGR